MLIHENSDQALRQLLEKLPEEQIPAHLNAGIMKHIHKASESRRRWNLLFAWASVGGTSIAMIIIMISVFRHLSIDFTGILRDAFSSFPQISFSILSLYILVGVIALVLLYIDYRIRKQIFRKSDH